MFVPTVSVDLRGCFPRARLALSAVAWTALVSGSPAWAAVATVHVSVVSDPGDGLEGAEAAATLAGRLEQSGTYDVASPSTVEQLTGQDPGGWFSRCGSYVSCWRGAAAGSGLDQLVLVERIDVATYGVRVVDVASDKPFRLGTAASPIDESLLDRLFFGMGTVRLVGVPADVRVLLDGAPVNAAEFTAPAGKHVVEIEAGGRSARWIAVLVVPDERSIVAVQLDRARATRPRQAVWLALAIAAVGSGLLVVGASAGGAMP